MALRFAPLTKDRWLDAEVVFGPNGACAGCWCMWWRQTRSVWNRNHGDANRHAFHDLVAAGEAPGLIGYFEDRPVAWVAVQPRSAYPSLNRSPKLRRVDDEAVWSITCMFIHRQHRGCSLSVALIGAACDHVLDSGGSVVEGYPIVPRAGGVGAAEAFTGTLSAFETAGFVEVARRGGRPIVRRTVNS